MIGQRISKTNFDDAAYLAASEWCNQNNAKILDNGDYYEVVALESVQPEITPEMIQAQLTQAVQDMLDTEAQTLGYDDVFTAISYVGDEDPVFAAEGIAFKKWRSRVWRTCYDILDQVKAGEREIPTEEELLSELPSLQINYGE